MLVFIDDEKPLNLKNKAVITTEKIIEVIKKNRDGLYISGWHLQLFILFFVASIISFMILISSILVSYIN